MPAGVGVWSVPRGGEMVEGTAQVLGGLAGGVLEGVAVKLVPKISTLSETGKQAATWGILIGMPIATTVGALYMRGLAGSFLAGMAAGGWGIVGYTLPALIKPTSSRRVTERELAARDVKLLGMGAAERAQAMGSRVASTIEF